MALYTQVLWAPLQPPLLPGLWMVKRPLATARGCRGKIFYEWGGREPPSLSCHPLRALASPRKFMVLWVALGLCDPLLARAFLGVDVRYYAGTIECKLGA